MMRYIVRYMLVVKDECNDDLTSSESGITDPKEQYLSVRLCLQEPGCNKGDTKEDLRQVSDPRYRTERFRSALLLFNIDRHEFCLKLAKVGRKSKKIRPNRRS